MCTWLCAMTLLSSCKDDEPNYPIETEVAGTYKGALSTESSRKEAAGMPEFVTLTQTGINRISLKLKNVTLAELSPGDILIDECKVSKNADTYYLIGTQTLDGSKAGIGKYDVAITGRVTGSNLRFELTIHTDATKQPIIATFEGVRLTGNESSEARITGFRFEHAPIVTEQPQIDEASGRITFKVLEEATEEQIKELVPTIEFSDKAMLTPESGVKQDFNTDVTYTVVSENGHTTKVYTVSLTGRQASRRFTFDEWKLSGNEGDRNRYEVLTGNDAIWASSLEGAVFLALYGVTGYPMYPTDDAINGRAVRLVTMDTSQATNSMVPALTSGSIYLGTFDLMQVILHNDRLASTRFGIAYSRKPVVFKGWYKYAPGEKYINGEKATKPEEVVVVPDAVDECAIQAVLYEAKDADGKEVTLTGHDINSSEYRVAVARLADGTAKDAYTHFELPFEYLEGRSYDPAKTYKLAIVCSSSKDGDFFKGAGGSTLCIDEFEVIGETPEVTQ